MGDTVIVLAQEGNRALRMGEVVRNPLAVCHYGEANLAGAERNAKCEMRNAN